MKKLLIGATAVFTVVALWGLYGDVNDIRHMLGSFEWWLAPLLVGLTVLSFGVRYFRWEVLLGRVSKPARAWDRKESALAFLAGLAGILTPLKAGELARAHFAHARTGMPRTTSVAIILSERVIDGVAMVLLAGLGIFVYSEVAGPLRGIAVAALAVLAVLVVLVTLLRNPSFDRLLARQTGRLLAIDGTERFEDAFTDSMRAVMGLRLVALSLALGTLSWAFQAVIYMIVVASFGAPVSLETFSRALFIFPTAILVGTLSLLPLGVGTADATLVFLGELLLELSPNELIAAAIITRSFIVVPALTAGFLGAVFSSRRRRDPVL